MIECCNHCNHTMWGPTTTIPGGGDAWQPAPQLITQNELVRFLRIPEISSANFDYECSRNLRPASLAPMHLVPAGHQLRRWSDCNLICGEDRNSEHIPVASAFVTVIQKLRVVFGLTA